MAKARLTDTEIAYIVFNETRSLKDSQSSTSGFATSALPSASWLKLDTSVSMSTPLYNWGIEQEPAWCAVDPNWNSSTPAWKLLFETKELPSLAQASNGGITQARINIAHSIMNADATGKRLPAMAAKKSTVPKVELSVFSDCVKAVQKARSEVNAKIDPTSGATHFNFRKNDFQGTFFGFKLKTSIGPLDNSYPTKALPATGIYANTYG